MKPSNTSQACELCQSEASVYCDADSAFLCWACDAQVHAANFLVARHVRRLVCSTCHSLGRCITGAASIPLPSICRSCQPDPPHCASGSECSCTSTAESSAAAEETERKRGGGVGRRRRGARAEAAMARWGRGMGVRGARRCARVAPHVLEGCGGVMTGVPFRVAALWWALRACGAAGTCEEGTGMMVILRRLEECCGVPARLIVVAESRLARFAGEAGVAAEEGSAEC